MFVVLSFAFFFLHFVDILGRLNWLLLLVLFTPFTPNGCAYLFSQAQVIAQAIGQAFGVAYQQFLQANGIKASELRPSEYSDYLGTQELYNGDLVHFSDSDNIREVRLLLLADTSVFIA